MSVMYYIAANKELPTGESGSRKIKSAENPKMIQFLDEAPPDGSTQLNSIIDLSGITEAQIETYQSHEDAAGIYVEEIGESERDVRIQFKNKCIYSLQPNWGKFLLYEELRIEFPESYSVNRKCITELMDYCCRNLNDSEELELYTCWADEEGEKRDPTLDRKISIKSISPEEFFEIEDRQYILITK